VISQSSRFPELSDLYSCIDSVGDLGEVREEGWVRHKDLYFPLLSFHFGPPNPELPTLIFIGGVHGLEKIGTHVVTSYLKSFIRLLTWDHSLSNILKECRILFYPLANPVGMFLNKRSNGRGVDLMRNAPIEATEKGPVFIRGHRISPHLPWYRGSHADPFEEEAAILCRFIEANCFNSQVAVTLDVHSGFGLVDRLWFPFAYSRRFFPQAPQVLALKRLLDQSYPHHVYLIEPQHHSYTTHGDLWDYLYLQHQKKFQNPEKVFLPLSLEMGSWHWIKKNPRQIFSIMGIFNPILPHRIKRAERRHFLLFNFLVKAIISGDQWAVNSRQKNLFLEKKAREIWY
jgi:hypothetical protein